VINVTATTCEGCFGTLPQITLNAQFTVVATTATYFNSGSGNYFTMTKYEVTGIEATFDGEEMSLASPTHGDGSWLSYNNGQFTLGTVYFTFAGDNYASWLENDFAFNLVEISDANGDDYGQNIVINWNAVPTPEPGTCLFLAIGLLGLAVTAKRSKTPA